MYARLWWKETRTFWPLWPVLALAAAGVQGFLLFWSESLEVRNGLLIWLGVGWALLHAFAVGSAAFAGERESNTQVFLDTLPVGRGMLWTSKVSFALATTLGLALALAALGAIGTTTVYPRHYSHFKLIFVLGVLLFEGAAWSLLWSVVLGSAIQAAVLGMVTVAFVLSLVSWNSTIRDPLVASAPLRLVLALLALGRSWVLFTRPPRRDTAFHEIIGARSMRRERTRTGAYGALLHRLAWETARESQTTWLLLAGVALGLPLMARLGVNRAGEAFWPIVSAFTILLAGVSVFGAANRTRSYRFLAQHGVRPGAVWTVKLLVWGVVVSGLSMASALALITLAVITPGPHQFAVRDSRQALGLSIAIFEGFVIALFLGQVLKRNITAWVVACLASFMVAMPQILLVQANLIPEPGLVLFPLLVLAISWAWTGDWMNDLRGPARWLRLGAMVAGAAVLLVSVYIGYRAWSVPDVGAPFPPRAAATKARPAPDQDAAPDYARILRSVHGQEPPHRTEVDQLIISGWDPTREAVVGWWEPRRGLVEQIRRAAEKPEVWYPPGDRWNGRLTPFIRDQYALFMLLGIDNFERRWRGDIAGAWDDLRAAFRMASQIEYAGGYADTRFARSWRTQALQWALAWAGDPRQTSPQLRAALDDFRAIPPPAPLADSLEAEYTWCDRALRFEPDRLVEYLAGESMKWSPLRKAIDPWWERERARRVLRFVFANWLQLAQREPWQRGPDQSSIEDQVRWYVASTPLVRPLLGPEPALPIDDSNLVLSRAFYQVVALRIWQLEHGGHYPDSLAALVPDPFPVLPWDPYTHRPFLYQKSGEPVPLLPLGLSGIAGPIRGWTARLQPVPPGRWLLYSVGPNGHDDGARFDYETNPAAGDLIFPLPP